MTAVIGKNGVGKSVLFDAFGFLADALKSGVDEACDARGRGGFEKMRTQGESGPIDFEVYYRENVKARPITYEITIDADSSGLPYVTARTSQTKAQKPDVRPAIFVFETRGRQGSGMEGEEGYQEETENFDLLTLMESITREEPKETETIELEDNRKFGIATLGALKQHPRISAFRRFIEGWHLSYFTPDAARSLPMAGAQKHLNIHGDNLGNVVQFMAREHPQRFKAILKTIADKIPGIDQIDTEKTSDGRLLLKFNDKEFQDPFYAQQVSDGTLKVFAYLLLLDDPTPPPFLCIEEPENGLYHKLLEALANEFREHASRRKGSQVFVTTHQPYFVDSLNPEEVWILEKGADGFFDDPARKR